MKAIYKLLENINYLHRVVRRDETMILNLKHKNVSYKGRKYFISKTQMKILLLLADNEIHTMQEIMDYMGYKVSQSILPNIEHIENEVPGIEIFRKKYLGYRLVNKMLIDY